MFSLRKIAEQLLNESNIKNIWNQCSKKAINFGDFNLPRIKIINSKRVYGKFEYPPNSDFYNDFNKSTLYISQMTLKNEELLKQVIEHEFAHCVIWKEYPSIKAHHPPEFFKIFRSIFGYETSNKL